MEFRKEAWNLGLIAGSKKENGVKEGRGGIE
jgi:hypothetical protein